MKINFWKKWQGALFLGCFLALFDLKKSCKPIALLLAKNGCFLALFDLSWELKKVENGGFLAKMAEPIALLFGKNGFFRVLFVSS